MSKPWTTKDIPTQSGKRILITGANSGIGWNTALELARAGAEVTIPCRTQAKADDAVARIRAILPSAHLHTAVMDVSNMASVRAFAAQQLEDRRPIDTLINNAGVMGMPKRTLSVDGFEIQFATNVLGHFLLTGLLLPAILRASAPRVVTVASSAHAMGGPLQLDNLNSDKRYKPFGTYAQTKLENVLFARELQRRARTRLLSTTCHPGYARTSLQFSGPGFGMKVASVLFLPVSQSSAKGAEPTLFAATSLEASPAAYYGPDGIGGMRGNVKDTQMAKFAYDDVAGNALFERLEELTGIRYAL
ncbi:oxidoreductase [Terriglobus saanensis]|uniref:Short-chain dehydrogenase/reductase SDR n=1 Tax=Terriglobus saanensis (strain ATCC BAA-1853 / DSM 23119 / SP1PR4) TaxID=401053 RepID=E8V3M4_TERSS|nr:oxidoreductase [Terriglobus saanensis]ADV84711.1 short-chain dehydrogenase/reductase SDR [Terriglobus saanensis SP1PR4]